MLDLDSLLIIKLSVWWWPTRGAVATLASTDTQDSTVNIRI